jgi:hypothetical protein
VEKNWKKKNGAAQYHGIAIFVVVEHGMAVCGKLAANSHHRFKIEYLRFSSRSSNFKLKHVSHLSSHNYVFVRYPLVIVSQQPKIKHRETFAICRC